MASTWASASATTATTRARWPAPSHRRAGSPSTRSTCPSEHGFDIPTGAKAARRVPCSACGLSKRHLFDEAARTRGYDVLVTGHNLDDEAAVLFGNVLHWQTDYLGRQLPVLPGAQRLPEEGEAARPPRRAGDGRLLRAAPHRLHRRGVPDGGGQQAPRVQGGAQRDRGHLAGQQARLLLRVPRPGVGAVHPRGRGRAGAAAGVQPLRRAHHGRGVRVLPPGGAGHRRCPWSSAGRPVR